MSKTQKVSKKSEKSASGAGRPTIIEGGGSRKNVILSPESIRKAKIIGDNQTSQGIRRAVEAIPVDEDSLATILSVGEGDFQLGLERLIRTGLREAQNTPGSWLSQVNDG